MLDYAESALPYNIATTRMYRFQLKTVTKTMRIQIFDDHIQYFIILPEAQIIHVQVQSILSPTPLQVLFHHQILLRCDAYLHIKFIRL